MMLSKSKSEKGSKRFTRSTSELARFSTSCLPSFDRFDDLSPRWRRGIYVTNFISTDLSSPVGPLKR